MNLMKISLIRGMSSTLGISKVEQRDANVVMFPEKPDFEIWTSLAAEYKGRMMMNAGSKPYITCRVRKEDKILDLIIEILKKYTELKFPKEDKKAEKKS